MYPQWHAFRLNRENLSFLPASRLFHMDPGGGFLLIGHQFDKCSEMPVAGLLVLKTTPPMIEPSWIDLVFSAEGGSGQAAVDLFADEALPVA